MKYRAAATFIIDLERYFVIPDDGRPVEDFLIAGRRISDEIAASCPTMEMAVRIAHALTKEGT